MSECRVCKVSGVRWVGVGVEDSYLLVYNNVFYYKDV